MRKLLFITLLIPIFVNAQFIKKDKQLHFYAGALIGASTNVVVYKITKDKKKAFWYGVGASVLAGFAKEVLDSREKGNKFDSIDLLATGLGGFAVNIPIKCIKKRDVIF